MKKAIPYHVRWGNPCRRTIKGHPQREARRERALSRFSVLDFLPWVEQHYPGRDHMLFGDIKRDCKDYEDYVARKQVERKALEA